MQRGFTALSKGELPSTRRSYHCGRIAFEVEGEFDGAMACNSICQHEGSLFSVPVQLYDGRSL